MPMRGELQTPTLIATGTSRTVRTDKVLGLMRDRDLIAVLGFVVFGLVVTAYMTLMVPLSEETLAALSQFL
jgi:hypothetical protein